jgi:hypothetical protein
MRMEDAAAPSAEDLRAERARKQIELYVLAERVGMHPGRLGAMLNERLPLRPAVAERIAEALRILPPRAREPR